MEEKKGGRVICDTCGWASKRNDLTGYKDLLTICGYLKRRVHPEPMWCPPCVLIQGDAAGGLVVLKMTAEKAQEEFALHWLPNEDLAVAYDAAEQDAAEGGWTPVVEAGEGDMEKREMLERIRRLESTEERLSERVDLLEDKLRGTLDRLEFLRRVVMEGGPDRERTLALFSLDLSSAAMAATHGG